MLYRMEMLDHLISPHPYLTPEDIQYLRHEIFGLVPDLLAALAVLIGGLIFYKLTVSTLRRVLRRRRVEEWLAQIIAYNVYKSIIVVITIVTALGQLGIDIGASLTGLGILGVAVGFAAQDSFSNIVAGFLISIDKPFRVGDYITIDKHYGRIELITMRSTRIRTQNNTYVVIPNQKIINDIVVDHSTNGETRINIPVSIIYEASVEEARAAILKEVSGIDGVLTNPAPDVVVDKLGESGVDLLVRVWIPNAAKERQVYFRTTELVKQALDGAGIGIAYPHLELVNKKS